MSKTKESKTQNKALLKTDKLVSSDEEIEKESIAPSDNEDITAEEEEEEEINENPVINNASPSVSARRADSPSPKKGKIIEPQESTKEKENKAPRTENEQNNLPPPVSPHLSTPPREQQENNPPSSPSITSSARLSPHALVPVNSEKSDEDIQFSPKKQKNCVVIYFGIIFMTIGLLLLGSIIVNNNKSPIEKKCLKILSKLDDPLATDHIYTVDDEDKEEILKFFRSLPYIEVSGNIIKLISRPPTFVNKAIMFCQQYPGYSVVILIWALCTLYYLLILFFKARARYYIQVAVEIINSQPNHQIYIDQLREVLKSKGICTFGMWGYLCEMLESLPTIQRNCLPYSQPFYSIVPYRN